jgi:L-fucose mutarotase
MLKTIPKILTPEILKVLAEMGHGDEIVIADGNFPAASICSCGPIELRADGHGAPELLKAVLKLFPLDTYSDPNLMLMEVMKGDKVETPIWDKYRTIAEKADSATKIGTIERFAFYERAKKAYAVIATGETALYANIILKKGVVTGGITK